ncbi:MAG: cupin domain-containing protein [Promethearchaeota archaeon]
MKSSINLKDKIKEINEKPWHPVDVARLNDQVIRLALFKGEYHWHKHENEDELFYVIKGKITIQLREEDNIVLNQGEMTVIPKGIMHCPKSKEDSYVLMFEPYKLQSKGD